MVGYTYMQDLDGGAGFSRAVREDKQGSSRLDEHQPYEHVPRNLVDDDLSSVSKLPSIGTASLPPVGPPFGGDPSANHFSKNPLIPNRGWGGEDTSFPDPT